MQVQEHVGDFDHYARLVRRLLGVPVALVSMVEPDRQVFLGAIGLPAPYDVERETPLSHSFCQYVVKDERPLIISDARLDPRLADNLAIEDLQVVAYAGWPVLDHLGRAVGSLCAIDSQPREWTRDDMETLEDLAAACSAEISQRSRADDAALAVTSAEEFGEQTLALLALSTALTATVTLADVAAAVVRVGTLQLGCRQAGIWLRDTVAVDHARRDHGRRPSEQAHARAESLRLVDGSSSWQSARYHAELPLDETNPLGLALVRGEVVAFASRDEQNALYPHLVNPDQVGEARVFLPLHVAGVSYGVLVLVWDERRALSDQNRVSMAALASYAAQAVQRAQLLQQRVDTALTLQHAMLTELPPPGHLTLTARYRPAAAREEVGGDWYDAFVDSRGLTHVVIGDVAGHDIVAAALMGQLRSMLRITGWLAGDGHATPAGTLSALDDAMDGLAVDTFATVVVARVERSEQPGTHLLRWSNAGHLPPLLLEPDGGARFLAGGEGNDPMLGLAPGVARRDHTAVVPVGSRLLLYTDGLVERRTEHLDVGLERLRAAAAGWADEARGDHDDFLDALIDEMVGDDPDDDVAVLTIHLGGEPGRGS